MKALDISLEIWYAESMKVEFTEQELAVIAYGLEHHIANLNKNIQALLEGMFDSDTPDHLAVLDAMLKARRQARTETRWLLAKVEHFIGKDY